MNTGKTLFAQLMDFLPWTTFTRIVDRYGGDHRVRTLSCAEQYRSMAFAQLTCRESLRDIETCLSVHASKLYHMGFRQPVRRSTLADANERRDWRIHAALAQRLITQARTLYVDEELGLDLTNTVYALDSTTIALCLSVFPWVHFRTTKAAVKMHTLLDLRGNIPSFIHISDGKLHDVHALDMLLPEAGAIYVVDRGYVDFARLYVLHQAGAFFVTRAKSNIDAHRVFSAPTDRSTGIICDQTISLDGFYTRQDYPELLRRIRFKDPESGKTLVFITNNFSLPAATICALYKSRWQVELFFKWIKQHLRIKQFYGTSENAVKTQIWIAVSVYVLVAIVKKRLDLDASLYTLLQILSVTLFEKMPIHQALAGDENRCNASQITNQLNLFDFNRTLVNPHAEKTEQPNNQRGDDQQNENPRCSYSLERLRQCIHDGYLAVPILAEYTRRAVTASRRGQNLARVGKTDVNGAADSAFRWEIIAGGGYGPAKRARGGGAPERCGRSGGGGSFASAAQWKRRLHWRLKDGSDLSRFRGFVCEMWLAHDILWFSGSKSLIHRMSLATMEWSDGSLVRRPDRAWRRGAARPGRSHARPYHAAADGVARAHDPALR